MASSMGALFGILWQSAWGNSGWGNSSPWSNSQSRSAWGDGGSGRNVAVWSDAPKSAPTPSKPPAAPPSSGVTNIAQQGSPGGWGAEKGSPGGQVTYGGGGGGTYTSPTGQQITQQQAQVLGIVDAPGDVAVKAAQIGLTPESAFKQGATIPTLVEMKQTPLPEVTQARIEAIGQGMKLSPDIQAQVEKTIVQQKQAEQMAAFLASGTREAPIQFASEAAKQKAIDIASKSPTGSPSFYSYATPEETAKQAALAGFMSQLSLPTYSELGWKGTISAPTVGAPILAGLIAGGKQDYSGGLSISPEVVGAMAKARQDVQEQRTAAEFEKYSPIQKLGASLGMDPGAIIDLYASRSTFFGQPLAGKEIISIPKGWVGGEKDWTLRVPTKEEAEKAYTKTKAETVQELKDVQASKDVSAFFGLVPLTGQSAKIYRSVQYGATSIPSEAVVTFGAGALLGSAIPMAGALSRIGVGKVASKLATTEAKGVGAKAVETVVRKVAVPFAENAEALMNVAGAGLILGQVKKAGQAPGGLTIGTSVYEGAKLGLAYKGFKKTYEPTMGALKGIETLPKGGKPLSAVEKETADLISARATEYARNLGAMTETPKYIFDPAVGKLVKSTKLAESSPTPSKYGWTGEAPRDVTIKAPPSGQRITSIDKEIAGRSRWTGEGKAPSNYPKPPGRFGFSDLMGKLPESFGKYTEPSARPIRTSEYGYGQEVIRNPFEGFGGVSKTIVGMGKGLAERGELPVPDFGSGLLQNYMGTELQIKDLNVFRPEISPKIDMFGNLKEGKHEVGVTYPVWTGSELGYESLNRYRYRYQEPTKPGEGYPTKPEYPGLNPIEYPGVTPPVNIDENIFRNDYIYETRKGTPPPPSTPGLPLFLPPKLGGGGYTGFGGERTGKSLREHKLTDPTSLFTGETVFRKAQKTQTSQIPTGMMTLSIRARKSASVDTGKVASMFELSIQPQAGKTPKKQRQAAFRAPKQNVPSGHDLFSLNMPKQKKVSKRRK